MTTGLNIGPVRPSFQEADNGVPIPQDFGPDFTQTPEKEPPKVNQKNPPKPAKDAFKLGQNKKLRSPVRRLTREAPTGEKLSDFDRLVAWYQRIGKMTRMFHPKFAVAVYDQAEDCAEAWFDLAETNDTVRRYILGFIEGGAWTKVIAAHTPIFMAVIPEEVLTRFFLKGMGLFARNVEQPSEEDMQMMAQVFGGNQE